MRGSLEGSVSNEHALQGRAREAKALDAAVKSKEWARASAQAAQRAAAEMEAEAARLEKLLASVPSQPLSNSNPARSRRPSLDPPSSEGGRLASSMASSCSLPSIVSPAGSGPARAAALSKLARELRSSRELQRGGVMSGDRDFGHC